MCESYTLYEELTFYNSSTGNRTWCVKIDELYVGIAGAYFLWRPPSLSELIPY